MLLPETCLNLINDTGSKFVSLKYLDNQNILRQLDLSTGNIKNTDCKLIPIAGKFFQDPFRSHSTITIFCETEDSLSHKVRSARGAAYENIKDPFVIYISFAFKDIQPESRVDNMSDPYDIHSNLRSDIVDILEKISINTIGHFYAQESLKSIIMIENDNLLSLVDNYVIAKFIIMNIAYSYGQEVLFTEENGDYSFGIGLNSELNFYCKNKEIKFSSYKFDINASLNSRQYLTKISYQSTTNPYKLLGSEVDIKHQNIS